VTVSELVEQSASVALEHALELQRRLETAVAASESDDPSIALCGAELRRLVADIASLRNATTLLQRQIALAG
jgi:hypothetical protein